MIEDIKMEQKTVQPAQNIETVKLATKWIDRDECYKIYSKPRGLCLILNNYNFDNIKETRYGSDRDAKMLDSIFTQLGYIVDLHEDKKAEEMKLIFQKFAKRPEHELLDSCVIIIMSHGDQHCIYGTDCEAISLNGIFRLFNNDNCRALLKKPKLFFIQACRGVEYDRGVPITQYHDAVPQAGGGVDERYASWTDMIITYSTIEGYIAFRDKNFGSWFMQTLIEVLMKRAWNSDLMTMLRDVSRSINTMESTHGEKQSIEIIQRGVHYLVYFNPGLKRP